MARPEGQPEHLASVILSTYSQASKRSFLAPQSRNPLAAEIILRRAARKHPRRKPSVQRDKLPSGS
eukprot:3457004-Rhodomonas_salina.1